MAAANKSPSSMLPEHGSIGSWPPSSSTEPETLDVGGGKFQILGAWGSNGNQFIGTNKATGEHVMIKIEDSSEPHLHFINEASVYSALKNVEGFPAIKWMGTEDGHNILVLEQLGASVEEIFLNYAARSRRFTSKTIMLIAEHALRRLQSLHEKSYVHRAVKLDYLRIGTGEDKNIYLVGLGRAKKYITEVEANNNGHIPFRENVGAAVNGIRYASINSHRGYEQSRRDDLESLGYSLIHLKNGELPWQGIADNESATRADVNQQVLEMKMQASVMEGLCKDFPNLATYLNYCKNLGFEESPDYDYLRSLFSCRLDGFDNEWEEEEEEDYLSSSPFDWLIVAPSEQYPDLESKLRTEASSFALLNSSASIFDESENENEERDGEEYVSAQSNNFSLANSGGVDSVRIEGLSIRITASRSTFSSVSASEHEICGDEEPEETAVLVDIEAEGAVGELPQEDSNATVRNNIGRASTVSTEVLLQREDSSSNDPVAVANVDDNFANRIANILGELEDINRLTKSLVNDWKVIKNNNGHGGDQGGGDLH